MNMRIGHKGSGPKDYGKSHKQPASGFLHFP